MGKLDIEAVDLKELCDTVRDAMDASPLAGEVVGRSQVRDVIAAHLGCSILEAEELADTLVARGWARLELDDDGRPVWRLEPPPP